MQAAQDRINRMIAGPPKSDNPEDDPFSFLKKKPKIKV